MKDKVQKIKDWISKEQEGLMDAQGNFEYPEHEGAYHILCSLDAYIDSLQEEPKFKVGDTIRYLVDGDIRTIIKVREDSYKLDDCSILHFNAQDNWELVEEPVSELPNTESMIESYKQRLISQANGMKNSPLIDMCLASYKHGINETLDTLKLSNNQRIGKERKEPVSEDLEKASKEWLAPQLDKSYANYGEAKMMELTHFDGYAMLDAVEFGAQWKEEQLAHCDAQTEEEAEVERDFVTGIIKKEHRLPTFDDAIKYGMRLQKEQLMKNTADAMIGLPYENKDGGYTHLIDVSRPLPVGNNKIAIIFKED